MTLRRCRSLAAPAAALLAALLAAASLASCSSRLGWGVVLWTSEDGRLRAGDVAPVYIKSNIQSLYVLGVPGTKDKIELPLWQVQLFRTKRAAEARVAAFGEYKSVYMAATLDGVPVRDQPSNAHGSQVYRLRGGQSVKVLEKVEGEEVTTGGKRLPGDWYNVLAEDGTLGYAYSFAFKSYDETKEGPPVIAASKKALSGRVDLLFTQSWRPEYFQEMLDRGRVDLDLFSLRYGLFVDAIHKQLRLELPGASKLFTYSSISESDGVYSFGGTPLRAKIESERKLLLSWVDEAPGQSSDAADQSADSGEEGVEAPVPDEERRYKTAGSDGRATLISLDSDLREAIRLEELRRQKLLEAFVDEGAAWSSADSGTLSLAKNRRFSWTGRGSLPDGFLPEPSGEYGDAAFRLSLDPALSGEWDGAFSLRFDAPEQADPGTPRPAWLDFAYRVTPEGLVLAPVAQGFENLVAAELVPGVEPVTLSPASR